jgi:Cyclic nucleotide-binding domain
MRWCSHYRQTRPAPCRHTGHGRQRVTMRIESSVTSLSWIPSEAVRGGTRVAFDAGFTHYDAPPPDAIDDLEALAADDRFRFANCLSAAMEVDEHGTVTACSYTGGGMIGATTVRLGAVSHTFEAFALPDLQAPPEVGVGWVRFTQTAGGRTGLPAPRRVRRRPFVQWQAPLVWTTLSLTLHADREPEFEVRGASRFPRHWIYGGTGALAAKVGLTDFKDWYRTSFGRHTPWGDTDSPALVTAVETALERSLSAHLMHGSGRKPRFVRYTAGDRLVSEGEPGTDVFLVLDGVIRVEKSGERLAEYGPGAILGERAGVEGGVRTSTLVAVTGCRVAAVDAADLPGDKLVELSRGHRREGQRA